MRIPWAHVSSAVLNTVKVNNSVESTAYIMTLDEGKYLDHEVMTCLGPHLSL